MKKFLLVIVILCFVAVFCSCATPKSPASEAVSTTEVLPLPPLERMIFVNGELYLETGNKSEIELRCGTPDGVITLQVDNTAKPSQENQSNFGKDFNYQFGYENEIEVLIDGIWWVFEKQS